MRLGKRGKPPEPVDPGAEPSGDAAPEAGVRTIEVFDEFGRPRRITVDVWRTQVLPDALRRHWDAPDQLAGTITMALRDGFAADVVAAAEHLQSLEPPGAERGAVLLGVCLLESGEFERAEAVLRGLLALTNSATGWTNLAKVASARERQEEVRDDLSRALSADPNSENALLWLSALRKEEDGEAGWLEVMSELASREGSWRPQLWLGRQSLQTDQQDRAIDWYRQSLERAPNAPEALQMVSGDLGNAGLLDVLLSVCLPRWRPEVHGFDAGRNLLEAALQAERLDDAESILHRLHMLQTPNLPTQLRPYEDRLDELRARLSPRVADPTANTPLSVVVLATPNPLWWRPLAEPGWAIGPAQPGAVVGLTQLWAVVNGNEIASRKTEWRGRVARGTPWYVADLLRFNGIGAFVAMPVLEGRGMVLAGARDSEEHLQRLFENAEHEPTIIVTGQVDGSERAPTVMLEFLDAESLTQVAVTETPVPLGGLSQYVSETLTSLGTPCISSGVPAGDAAVRSVSGYEMLVNLAAIAQRIVPDAYWAERGTLNFLLDLAGTKTDSDTPVFVYLAALVANKGRGSDIYAEFEKRTFLLLDASTTGTAAKGMRPLASALFNHVDAPHGSDTDYNAWLKRIRGGEWYPNRP